jgi:methionine-rich copper-binding protein CopC
MKKLTHLLAIAAFAGGSAAAQAHPQPKTASPKPNAVLTDSPADIRIGFSEGLEVVFSGLEVDDPSGKPVASGPASLDPNDNKKLIVPLQTKLTPGLYTVKWHAVGTDTHHVTGHYSFQIK